MFTIQHVVYDNTVKLGNKERFDKEQIGIKELFMDYQPFYTINYMLNSKHLSLVNKICDKTEFTVTRVHCIKKLEAAAENWRLLARD